MYLGPKMSSWPADTGTQIRRFNSTWRLRKRIIGFVQTTSVYKRTFRGRSKPFTNSNKIYNSLNRRLALWKVPWPRQLTLKLILKFNETLILLFNTLQHVHNLLKLPGLMESRSITQPPRILSTNSWSLLLQLMMLWSSHKVYHKRYTPLQTLSNLTHKLGRISLKVFHLDTLAKIIFWVSPNRRRILLLLLKRKFRQTITHGRQRWLLWTMHEETLNKKTCHLPHLQKRNLQAVEEREKAQSLEGTANWIRSKPSTCKQAPNLVNKHRMSRRSRQLLNQYCKETTRRDRCYNSSRWTATCTSTVIQSTIQ